MNNNKVNTHDSIKLNIKTTILHEDRVFYLSTVSPYSPNNDIIIEEIDSNKDIIGYIKLPMSCLLGFSKELIECFQNSINYNIEDDSAKS